MNRADLGNLLNSLLEHVDRLQDTLAGELPSRRRQRARLDRCRDEVVLLALDLGFPVKPMSQEPKPLEKKDAAEDPDPAPPAG